MRSGRKDVRFIMGGGMKDDKGYLTGEGQVIGVSLGWDFVSEHEWGIAQIKKAFGIRDKLERSNVGADFRTITKVPDTFRFFPDLSGSAYLMYSDHLRWSKPEELNSENFDRMLDAYGEELATAWSESDFGVRMKNDVLKKGSILLGQIYDAFTKGDGMIFLGGREAFGNSGLVLAIRSRVPAEALEQMKAGDESYLSLIDASHATGIIAKLDATKMRYYACSPRWLKEDDERRATTAHPVIYWLNPMEQRKVNFGWFTVEELEQWILGKGPIPMAKEEVVEEE